MKNCAKIFRRFSIVFVLLFLFNPNDLSSQQIEIQKRQIQRPPLNKIKDRVNEGLLGVVTGRPGGVYIDLASEMAIALNQNVNEREQFRIIPMVSDGSVQNLFDLVYLRDTQLAFVQSDVLAYIDSGALEFDPDSANALLNKEIAEKRIVYVTKLHKEQIHILARNGINTILDLENKRVAVGDKNSGSALTASLIFTDIFNKDKPRIEPIAGDQALKALLQGDVDAVFRVVGKSSEKFSDFSYAEGYKFLEIDIDELDLKSWYEYASFTYEDYPHLVRQGETIDTISVTAILAAYKFKPYETDYKILEKFVKYLGSRIGELQNSENGYSLKWMEVNLADSNLDGWDRFEPADQIFGEQ